MSDLDVRVRGLVERCDARAAATEVIKALGRDVLVYLRAALRDEDDVADAHSEWAEHVWKGLPGFEWRSTLRTWSFRLASNVVHNLRDRAHRRRERRFLTGEASALAESMRTSSKRWWHRRRIEFEELRLGLTDEQRTLLFLRVDQDLTWEEIAEILSAGGEQVGADTVCKRFERLKARIARMARERKLLD
jgi:RNA polymerase sigma-70 factor (ECF subfamily)